MDAKRMLALWGVMAVAVVQAETLTWFHFDERDPGTVVTGDGTGLIENAVNPKMAPTVCVLAGDEAKEPGDSGYAAYAPQYDAPGRGIRVYDPVTGLYSQNRACMRFTTASSESGAKSYYGSAVRVAGTDTSSNPVDAFTIECFVCTTGGVGATFAPIFGKRCDSLTAESWALYMTSNGRLEFRLRTSGDNLAKITGTSGQGNIIDDGSWHHVAMTYDKTDGYCRVYVDYAESFKAQTYALKTGETVTYYTTKSDMEWKGALWVGGYPYIQSSSDPNGRKFNGCIDEFRISDKALAPSEFLRLRPADSDEMTRVRFDLQNYDKPLVNLNGNYNDYLDLPAKLTRGTGVNTSASQMDASTVYAATLREGIYASAQTNRSAFNVMTNGAGRGCVMKVASLATAMAGGSFETNMDYTVEAFFKVRRAGAKSGKQTVFKLGGAAPAVGLVLGNNAQGKPIYTYNNKGSWCGVTPSETTAQDGEWHHVAAVSDVKRKQLRFYYDHKLSAAVTDVENKLAADASLYIGAAHDSTQWFDGWIDDVRVMKRALRPDEFLTTHDVANVSSSDPTVLFANFEGDYATAPYPGLIGAGTGSQHGTAGAAPVFTARKQDWLLGGSNSTAKTVSDWCVTCDDSIIGWPTSPLLEQPSFTIEFMANITNIVDKGNFVRYATGSTYSGNPAWALYHDSGVLRVRIQLVTNGVSYAVYPGWSGTAKKVMDGRWHHVALTVAPNAANDQKTDMELFIDYASQGVKTYDGMLDYSIVVGGARLSWGASGTVGSKVYGQIDALRYSRDVLTPDKFIYRMKYGFSFFLR